MLKRVGIAVLAIAATSWACAQTVPQTPAEVARPGGTIAGAPKLALVKVADGFNDPVGVTAANDGSAASSSPNASAAYAWSARTAWCRRSLSST